MSTITFRLTDEEKEFLEDIAEFNQLTLSDFIRKRALEAAEDQMDIETYIALKKEHDERDQSISHEKMIEDLDL